MMRLVRLLPWLFLGIFGWIYGRDALHSMTSTENWFTVTQVLVMDTPEGADPRMVVTRKVNKPFLGEWIVAVRKLEVDGVVTVCNGTGKSYYIPEAKLPDNLTLEWWIEKKCDLSPGKYQIDTKWIMEIPGYTGYRLITSRSNIFSILPRT